MVMFINYLSKATTYLKTNELKLKNECSDLEIEGVGLGIHYTKHRLGLPPLFYSIN